MMTPGTYPRMCSHQDRYPGTRAGVSCFRPRPEREAPVRRVARFFEVSRFYFQPGNQTMSLKRSSEISIQESTGQNQMNRATAPATIAHAIGR